jgi:hypothetical protein
LRGVELSRRGVTGFFLLYCNRFIGIPGSKGFKLVGMFYAGEAIAWKMIFPIDTIV